MKPFLLLAGVLVFSAPPGIGQAPPKVPDADIKKLGDAFSAMIAADARDDFKKKEAARNAFKSEFDRIEKNVKPGTLLAMPDVWTEVFYAKRQLPKSPSGLGRVEEKKLGSAHAGKPVEFKYGLLLPNGFDVKKRYPLIVALHDKGAGGSEPSGPKYLNEVWMKLPKEERDQFIIMAPTMGPGSAGREFRVEWGDLLHIKSVALPLLEMLSNYPVDNDRIYLEGTGEGGEFAMHFALLKPHLWAGVAVRSALPRFPQVLPNGGSLPMTVHLRKGSPAETSQLKANFEHQKQTLGLPIEIKEHPAAEKPVRGAFASDTIPEASSEIAAFLAGKKRNLAPKKLVFVTDAPHFKECYWIRLGKFESDRNYTTKVTASVDEAANTIDIQTQGVESLRVYLNDRVVNMDRPVKITVNGQPHTEKQFTRSLTALIKYFEDNPADPGIQPTELVEIDVPVAAESPPSTETNPAKPK